MRSSDSPTRPTGIWAPECAYAPGMEIDYAAAGVGHFMVDGPSLHGDTALGRPVADSDVVAFGRDLQVSYRVWSPKSGYPGHRRLPGLPHLRPRHRPQARPGDRTQRALGCQGALRPAARRRRGRRPRRRFRRHGAGAAAPARARGIGGPRTSSPLSTPSCSVTGGTRAPSGWSGCCGRCPRRGCGSARSRTRSPTATSVRPSNCRRALGVRARTGRCGPASKVADLVQLNSEVVDTALTTVDKALAQAGSSGSLGYPRHGTSSPTRSCARPC